jgi:adenosylmethionine-8-amino-7-oxononanoate aminotransferase
MISYAQENNVICIADEVLTGFGRTGKLFASDHLKNKPDIIALSKGLTGGTLPLGVTSCSSKILEAYETDDFSKTFFHGHSYTANPLSCAAANASFELLMRKECQDQISRISEWHKKFVLSLEGHRAVKQARSLGTIMALELKSEESSTYANAARKKIYPYFLSKGILLRPLGNIIYILPPYVITTEQLDYIGQTIFKFLEA